MPPHTPCIQEATQCPSEHSILFAENCFLDESILKIKQKPVIPSEYVKIVATQVRTTTQDEGDAALTGGHRKNHPQFEHLNDVDQIKAYSVPVQIDRN